MKKKLKFIGVLIAAWVLFGIAISLATTENTELSLNKSEIYILINQERAKRGLSKLTVNEGLNHSAELKLNHALDNHYWNHNSPSGIEPWHWFGEAGYEYSKAGEILAENFSTEELAVNGWLNSELHRAELLGQYDEFGIAVSGTNVVVHFATSK